MLAIPAKPLPLGNDHQARRCWASSGRFPMPDTTTDPCGPLRAEEHVKGHPQPGAALAGGKGQKAWRGLPLGSGAGRGGARGSPGLVPPPQSRRLGEGRAATSSADPSHRLAGLAHPAPAAAAIPARRSPPAHPMGVSALRQCRPIPSPQPCIVSVSPADSGGPPPRPS